MAFPVRFEMVGYLNEQSDGVETLIALSQISYHCRSAADQD
jgi:hypothetical protein